jgi:hypothetical protein
VFGELEPTHAMALAANAVSLSLHCAARSRLDMTATGTLHEVELISRHLPRRNSPVRDETP